MRRPSPAYWLRTAARVARRIEARALPVVTSDSQAAGGEVCAFGDEVEIITVRQFGDQGRDLTIDLAADGRVADIGMDGIGKINGIGSPRQRDQLAFGREAED